MDRHDRMMRQRDARIERRDLRRIPVTNCTGVDSGEHRSVQLEMRRVQPRQVVVDGLRGNRQRNVDDLRMLPHLGIGHIGIGRADLHLACQHLLDAGLRAGSAHANVNARMRLGIGIYPGRKERIQQGRAGFCQREILRIGRRARHQRERCGA